MKSFKSVFDNQYLLFLIDKASSKRLDDHKFVFMIGKVFCHSFVIGKAPSKQFDSQKLDFMID